MQTASLGSDPSPNLTPREIVAQLDRFIIGQGAAKRAVANALRNRRRRQLVAEELQSEIMPKNILMIGSTGVGKTEIARRLAKLAHAPFYKVEASKFTEVGYVGRDVESMIRDLVEIGVAMVREEQQQLVREKARNRAEERLLEAFLADRDTFEDLDGKRKSSVDQLREELAAGKHDQASIALELNEQNQAKVSMLGIANLEDLGSQLRDMMPQVFGSPRKKKRQLTVKEAREALLAEEEQKLVDMDSVVALALQRVQNTGIIFLDEIDKIAGAGRQLGPDVSREGVQRDLLPIIEGTTVNTKHGMVRTDHILFIAAGAFHVSKPSDLIPELQGRFPVTVELDALSESDFLRILSEPHNALVRQYQALMAVEHLDLVFEADGLALIAHSAFQLNERKENLGARRLHTVMERVMEDLSFEADKLGGQRIVVDAAFVRAALGRLDQTLDLHQYIL
jgi:ATP-dependent HslUV protease ATP-binding subunit HslU